MMFQSIVILGLYGNLIDYFSFQQLDQNEQEGAPMALFRRSFIKKLFTFTLQ